MKINNNIAILLATYNGEHYLAEQIDSILRQSFTDWRLYIHDDGSTDRTLDIIKKYSKDHPKNIYHLDDGVIFKNPQGNFLHLLNSVQADWYLFCDQDDFWVENKISSLVDSLKSDPNTTIPSLAFSDASIVDQSLSLIHPSLLRNNRTYANLEIMKRNLIFRNCVTGCTMMINNSAKNMTLKYPSKNIVMHDWWLALVVLFSNGKFIFIDKPLVLYRQHDLNLIGASNDSLSRFFSIDIYRNLLNKYHMIRMFYPNLSFLKYSSLLIRFLIRSKF
jgi:glycosyltransferase involved in cell wall biosynthesis